MGAHFRILHKTKVSYGPAFTPVGIVGVEGCPLTALEFSNTGQHDIIDLRISYQACHGGETWDWLSTFAVGGDIVATEGKDIKTLGVGETGLVILNTQYRYALIVEAMCEGGLGDYPKKMTTLEMRGHVYEH